MTLLCCIWLLITHDRLRAKEHIKDQEVEMHDLDSQWSHLSWDNAGIAPSERKAIRKLRRTAKFVAEDSLRQVEISNGNPTHAVPRNTTIPGSSSASHGGFRGPLPPRSSLTLRSSHPTPSPRHDVGSLYGATPNTSPPSSHAGHHSRRSEAVATQASDRESNVPSFDGGGSGVIESQSQDHPMTARYTNQALPPSYGPETSQTAITSESRLVRSSHNSTEQLERRGGDVQGRRSWRGAVDDGIRVWNDRGQLVGDDGLPKNQSEDPNLQRHQKACPCSQCVRGQ